MSPGCVANGRVMRVSAGRDGGADSAPPLPPGATALSHRWRASPAFVAASSITPPPHAFRNGHTLQCPTKSRIQTSGVQASGVQASPPPSLHPSFRRHTVGRSRGRSPITGLRAHLWACLSVTRLASSAGGRSLEPPGVDAHGCTAARPAGTRRTSGDELSPLRPPRRRNRCHSLHRELPLAGVNR